MPNEEDNHPYVLEEVRFEIAYKKIRGLAITQLEADILELHDELYEAAMPGPPGLSEGTLAAIQYVLDIRGTEEDTPEQLQKVINLINSEKDTK
jgi:hypothetical protein